MRQANVSGKGAIFQVSDTKWIAKICVGVDDGGKPIIKQFSGKTEAIAKKKLRDFKKTADYAEKHLPSTDTVKAYFTAWMKDYRFHKLKPSSYTNEKRLQGIGMIKSPSILSTGSLCLFLLHYISLR